MTIREIAVAGPENPVTSHRSFAVSDGQTFETIISVTHLTNAALFDEDPLFRDQGDTPTNQTLINLLSLLNGQLATAPILARLPRE